MTLPATFAPGVATARRWYWLLEQRRAREGFPAAAGIFRGRRLEQPGVRLPRSLPGRARLLAAGVLALEEVLGADPTELAAYGLGPRTVDALINALERIAVTTPSFTAGPNAGQTYDQDDVILLASAARTTSTTTDWYELGDRAELRLELDVTAISGTGARLHVQIETRKDSSDATRAIEAFAAVTAVGKTRLSIPGVDRFVRAVCTFAGTSATYSLLGEGI